MELRYDAILEDRENDSTKKGERTRAALKRAAVQILNECGFRDMRVVDICQRAGVSKATFWVYFPDKTALTTELLQDFTSEFLSNIGTPPQPRSAYQAIFDANLLWIANIRANPGLMRCVLQISDEVPEFAKLHSAADDALLQRFSRSMKKRFGEELNERPDLEITLQALYGMMDSFTRKLISLNGSRLKEMVSSAGLDDVGVAHFLSTLWYKALFGKAPEMQS